MEPKDRMEPRDLRVLVVEDNGDAAESLRRLLALCGCQVTVAHTGREGLSAATRLQPHIVLCDIGLPDRNGYEVASMLRQAGDGACARLVAVTAYAEPQDRRRALAAGFDAHLAKPLDAKALFAELTAALDSCGHMFG